MKKQKEEIESPFYELFLEELQDIYYAENLLTKAIPEMTEAASSSQLKKAFKAHLKETETQISRLEQVFELLGEKAEGKKCDAMDGLVKEARNFIKEQEEGLTRDAGIIVCSQKVEHYEIAAYGSLATFAELMDLAEVKALLVENLIEEKTADEKLTDVALEFVNEKAAAE